MNKVLIGVALVIVVAIGGAGVYLMQNINPIVKGLIESVGSDVTKTKVSVADVDISLTDGMGTISGLTIANPDGFSNDNVFSLNNISVQIDIGTLGDEVIVIKSVGIDGARVLAEHVGGGTNVQALQNGMDQSSEAETGEPAATAEESLLALQRMTFTNGSVVLRSDMFGESTVPLPDFSVENLGTAEKGMTSAELGSAIATAMIGEVTDAVVDMLGDMARD